MLQTFARNSGENMIQTAIPFRTGTRSVGRGAENDKVPVGTNFGGPGTSRVETGDGADAPILSLRTKPVTISFSGSVVCSRYSADSTGAVAPQWIEKRVRGTATEPTTPTVPT